MKRRVLSVIAMLCLPLLCTAPAGATLSWSGPQPVDRTGGQSIEAVACPAAQQCTAIDFIGQVVTFDPAAPGTTDPVTIETSSPPAALACPATNECVATDDAGHAIVFDPASPSSAVTRRRRRARRSPASTSRRTREPCPRTRSRSRAR